MRGKPVAGSVTAAANAQGPQGGSATMFMAKQTKQQATKNNGAWQQPKSNGAKNKKKQNTNLQQQYQR